MPHTINQNCVGCVLCVHYCPVGAITGQKKQLHIIDPNICIDCGVCGRVCAFEAVQDATSLLVKREKPADWLRPIFIYERCVACNLCLQVCPTRVIGNQQAPIMERKDLLPWLQYSKGCIGCSFCANICPTIAIQMQKPQTVSK